MITVVGSAAPPIVTAAFEKVVAPVKVWAALPRWASVANRFGKVKLRVVPALDHVDSSRSEHMSGSEIRAGDLPQPAPFRGTLPRGCGSRGISGAFF